MVISKLSQGVTDDKDEMGSSASSDHGIVQESVRAIKKRIPELLVATDVCLCEYTSHGHCGVVREKGDEYEIVNDETVELLARELKVRLDRLNIVEKNRASFL